MSYIPLPLLKKKKKEKKEEGNLHIAFHKIKTKKNLRNGLPNILFFFFWLSVF